MFDLFWRCFEVLSEIEGIESWKMSSEKYLFLKPHLNQIQI